MVAFLALTACLSAFVRPYGKVQWLAAARPAVMQLEMTSTRSGISPSDLYDDDDDDDDDDDEAFLPEAERLRRAQLGPGTVVSPFASGVPARAAPAVLAIPLDLTVENVDKALDEVRPALVADGGNIDVVEVDAASGVVKLALQGACTTCPSATITMQQGVETTLRRLFPAITSVVSVSAAAAAEPSAPSELTLEAVQEVVRQILPAITGMGGSLRVLAVSASGRVEVEFSGPARVQYGVDLALRDNKLVKEVVFSKPEGGG